ncbi:MAG: hypothetical protein ACFFCQ_14395, partial [Promethearchaeota archaeon]
QGLNNVTLTIPYYYFLETSRQAQKLDILPKIEIFIVPVVSFDDEGIFVLTRKPLFLENEYDLREFSIFQPLLFGYVHTTLDDIDNDNNADSVLVTVVVVINEFLGYFLELRLAAYWDNHYNILEKSTFQNPTTASIRDSRVSFMFSEIFSSSNYPSQFGVNISVNLVSEDGILLDSYVTPVIILFHIENQVSTSSELSTTTSPSLTDSDKGDDNDSFILRLGLVSLLVLFMSGLTTGIIIFIRRRTKG